MLEGEAWMAQMWVWNGVNLPTTMIIIILVVICQDTLICSSVIHFILRSVILSRLRQREIICQNRLGTNTNEKNNSVKNIACAFVPQAAAMARPALAAMRSVQVA